MYMYTCIFVYVYTTLQCIWMYILVYPFSSIVISAVSVSNHQSATAQYSPKFGWYIAGPMWFSELTLGR